MAGKLKWEKYLSQDIDKDRILEYSEGRIYHKIEQIKRIYWFYRATSYTKVSLWKVRGFVCISHQETNILESGINLRKRLFMTIRLYPFRLYPFRLHTIFILSIFILSICLVLSFVTNLEADESVIFGKWTTVAPEIVVPPKFSENKEQGREIRLTSPNSIGAWNATFAVKAGTGCHIVAEAETEIIKNDFYTSCPGNDCMIILSWMVPGQQNPCQRDYVEFTDKPSDTNPHSTIRRFEQIFTVPEKSDSVKIECIFKWRIGKAIFRNVRIESTQVPAPRKVRLVAANPHTPQSTSIEQNLAVMEETLKNIFKTVKNPDLILFAECFTDTGVSGPITTRAEQLPDGPTFQLLSRYARHYHVWIAANVHEVTPEKVYHNTSFLVDRKGKLAGIYRKVHLTSSEFQAGIIPGTELPVFQTDFGKIGFVICWDNWFSETAKILRLKGAEVLLFPLAGDGKESHWSKIWSARAIDSSIPILVATQQSHLPSAIIDRDGQWLDETKEKNGFAWKELDLNDRTRSFWLSVGPSMGDPYQLYKYERRPEVY